jgi:LysM repeat protein
MGMLDDEKSGSKKEKAPRSVAEAKKQGKSTYTGKDGKQKAAVYKEDLGKGQSLKDYLNKGGGKSTSTNTDSGGKSTSKDSSNDNRAGSKNAVVNKGGKNISQQNREHIKGKYKEGVKSFGYGYYDQNNKWIYPVEDAQDGGGAGGSGSKFEGGISALSNAIEATPYGSGIEASGLAKFIQDGGVLGTMAKGIAGGVKNLVKPATYEVQKNDNLSKIAAANNMTLEQLLAKNPGLDPKAYIQPGQQIKIGGLFGGTPTAKQTAATAAMMAQMDNRDNNGIAAAPVGVQAVQCPAGQVFNPMTNSCEPALSTMTQAAQTSMPAGIPGIDNPSYAQIMAYRNAPQPLAPNLSSLTGMTGQFGAGVRMAAEGGIMSLVEAEGGNEKTLISDAIAAIESGAEDEAAAVALAKFVQVHGEDALRNLVEKVQSGDYADTRERFANGENGIVNGPGDGSGTDDKVPATIDGKQDVLLTNNEYVLREPTTAALEAALGKGGLDAVNAAEGDAPAVLRRLMNNVQAERQTA